MAERKRSSDGTRETEKLFGAEGDVDQGGRAGGRLPRQVGSKDELKRAYERPAGTTRVNRSMEAEQQEQEDE